MIMRSLLLLLFILMFCLLIMLIEMLGSGICVELGFVVVMLGRVDIMMVLVLVCY